MSEIKKRKNKRGQKGRRVGLRGIEGKGRSIWRRGWRWGMCVKRLRREGDVGEESR